jgi:hypothetical protein
VATGTGGASMGEGGGGASTGSGGSAPDAGPVCPTSGPNPAPYKGINQNPKFLQVYVNNVENLELPTDQCAGDWHNLFDYMKQNPSPDVFLVQQISGKAQLDFLVQYMTDHLPGVFAGIIAEPSPDAMKSPCGAPKSHQTNAIIYRTGRLTPVGDEHVWQSWAKIQNQCKRNYQARTRAVMQKFHDTVADKIVTVASMHWATFQGDPPDPACAEKNVEEIAQKVKIPGFGGDLMLFGGDANEPDRKTDGSYRPWYAEANGDAGGALGFRDPIFAFCKAHPPVKGCLDDNWTIGGDKRIDFLFTRRGDGCRPHTSGAHTITFPEAKQAAGNSSNYSDHRAIRVAVHY